MKLFKKLPINGYIFDGDDDYFFFRDIFIKLKIREGLANNPKFLTTHVLNSYERPDVIAHKLYNNASLFWTLYLVNDVVDPKEWLLDGRTLDRYTAEKYDNSGATHHYERNGSVADYRSTTIMTTINPFGTVDSAPEVNFTDATTYYPVSNSEHEEKINDSKRIIRAIRKEHIDNFLRDVENKLRGENV
jgi:hypothetical protein